MLKSVDNLCRRLMQRVCCYITANLDLRRVGRLRTTGYGLEDGQVTFRAKATFVGLPNLVVKIYLKARPSYYIRRPRGWRPKAEMTAFDI